MMLEIFKGCIFILIGAYLYTRFMPEPKPQEVAQKQEQQCKVIVKKVTKPDGSVEESQEITASSSQSQVVKVQSEKKHSISYIPKYSFDNKLVHHSAIYTYNNLGFYLATNKEIGLVFKLDF